MGRTLRVRRDDTVRVISGKDAGKTGKVLRVNPKKQVVFVEGQNIQKRHQKPRSVKDTQRSQDVGGVIEKEGPIHISNVMLVDPGSSSKGTRVGVTREEGKRKRVARRSGKAID